MFKMSTVFILHFVPSLRFTLSLNLHTVCISVTPGQ